MTLRQSLNFSGHQFFHLDSRMADKFHSSSQFQAREGCYLKCYRRSSLSSVENSAVSNYRHGNRRAGEQIPGQVFVTFRGQSLRTLWALIFYVSMYDEFYCLV